MGAFDDLKTACRATAATSDVDRVNEGESLWLAGQPVPAGPGLVGLSIGEGHAVLVSEAAVREVHKEDARFYVRVAAGTPALVRSETVTTLRESAHACGCSDRPTSEAAARVAGAPGGPGGGGPIIIQCPLVCSVEMNCSLVLTGSGRVLRICVPILSCRRECPSEPA